MARHVPTCCAKKKQMIKERERLRNHSRSQKELVIAQRLLEECKDKPIRIVDTEYLGGIYRHGKRRADNYPDGIPEDDEG